MEVESLRAAGLYLLGVNSLRNPSGDIFVVIQEIGKEGRERSFQSVPGPSKRYSGRRLRLLRIYQ